MSNTIMKKTILLFLLITFNINEIAAQQRISETEKLASLGKMYGFLKYYHPQVGRGIYNWDEEFMKYLPKVLNATDKSDLSTLYINWIESLGKIKSCEKCDTKETYFDNNFDLSWTQDTILFNKTLTSKLKYIENNRIQGENFYAATEQVGKIKITNEPVYKDFGYPNEQYRLLGLFKYWNIIEYFYPYKYLTDQKWDLVLKEMIPKFQKAATKEAYQSTIKELVAKLDDSHAWISFDENIDWKYLPVVVSNIDEKPVISSIDNDSLAKLNNLKLGDIILSINGMDVLKETERRMKLIPASNVNHKKLLAFGQIINANDGIASLTIERDNKVQDLKVTGYEFSELGYRSPNGIKSKSINDKIGYINMRYVQKKDVDEIFKSLQTKQSIIIDLRTYPAFLYKEFSTYLNSEKKDFAKIYSPHLNYPSRFIYKEILKTNHSEKSFKGKIYILVNEASMSLSEFTAMAFQTANNVTTIGSQTAGADGDLVVFEYIGGFRTAFSGNGILYPDGSETQRQGIKIDVEVNPTINGLRQGRDEVLEKAIELASE